MEGDGSGKRELVCARDNYGSIWETHLYCRPVEQCPVRLHSGGGGLEGDGLGRKGVGYAQEVLSRSPTWMLHAWLHEVSIAISPPHTFTRRR